MTRLFALVAFALTVLATVASAQTPQQQPLVQQGDVQLLGTITLPGGPDSVAVDGTTIYVSYGKCVQTLILPPIGGTATAVGPCAPVPNIDQVHPVDRNVIVGGILPYLGKFVTSAYVYYDGSAGATRSHWSGSSLTALAGPYTVSTAIVGTGQLGISNRPGMVGGGMGVIPPEWRTLLGGPALTGLCCVPIISRSSYGPSVSVFDPAHIDGRAVVPATMLIGYPIEHRTLGPWEGVSQYYGGTNQLGGVGFPAGTRSILFTGRHGDSWCYGPGTGDKSLVGTPAPPPSKYNWCYDPTDSYQGNHGPPYRPTMFAYDANDLIAVKQGTKKPWDVQPYAKWTLPGMPIDGVQNLMRAGYYDPSTKRYYVGMNDSNKLWVFAINVGAPPPPPVTCQGIWSPWLRVAGSETACAASQRNYTERHDFTITQQGTDCPISPAYRTLPESCEMPPPPPPTATTVSMTTGGVTTTCTLTVTGATSTWVCK